MLNNKEISHILDISKASNIQIKKDIRNNFYNIGFISFSLPIIKNLRKINSLIGRSNEHNLSYKQILKIEKCKDYLFGIDKLLSEYNSFYNFYKKGIEISNSIKKEMKKYEKYNDKRN